MKVTFTHIGLTFTAECDYEPLVRGRFSGPPELCYPDEGGAATITALSCNWKDASFLLGSDICEALDEAAYEACVEQVASDRDDAAESRAAARDDDRMMDNER